MTLSLKKFTCNLKERFIQQIKPYGLNRLLSAPATDLRALIHWEPKVKVDSSGNVSRTFYNGDLTGEVKVVVEAISEDGKIGYQELVYKVKERSVKK